MVLCSGIPLTSLVSPLPHCLLILLLSGLQMRLLLVSFKASHHVLQWCRVLCIGDFEVWVCSNKIFPRSHAQ